MHRKTLQSSLGPCCLERKALSTVRGGTGEPVKKDDDKKDAPAKRSTGGPLIDDDILIPD